jgi:hypothetical protein
MRHGAQEAWKIIANGAVGGQAIAGIPYLWKLKNDPRLREVSEVWPFSGFRDPTKSFSSGGVVHAEVFPNAVPWERARDRMPAEILAKPKDARQVWTLVDHARRLDLAGHLGGAFARPAALQSLDDVQTATTEEGWILFA